MSIGNVHVNCNCLSCMINDKRFDSKLNTTHNYNNKLLK